MDQPKGQALQRNHEYAAYCICAYRVPDGPTFAEMQWVNVTIPPLDPSARDEEEPDYDEEALVWAVAMELAAEVEDEETLDEYDWQFCCLVSAVTYTAKPDAGRVSTGRMKIT